MNKYVKYMSILIMLMAFAATTMLASAATPDPTTIGNATGNFWVNHTWGAGTGNVTDSYNVSVNGTWDNTTTNEYWNDSYSSAHAWQNIIVYAWNDTDGLSTSSVSQNTQIPNNQVNITNTSDETVDVGDNVYVDYDASDLDTTDTPTFSCNRTTDLFTDFDTVTGEGNWTAVAGTYYVDFGVSDGWGSIDNYTMTIMVSATTTHIPPNPTNLTYTEGKYWVRYEWDSGGIGTDYYNVSMNGTWPQNSTDTFLNTSVGPSGWANITVWAYNASGNGNLSAGNINDSVQVQGLPSGYDTGNRIWEAGSCGDTYRWTAQSFTGFYYDIDDGFSTETLTITDIKQTLKAGAIEYVTETREVKFDCSDWGKYNVIGFMAEKYFAGYDEDETDEITDETISLVSDKMLSKVLIDEDDKHTVSTGASLELQEGYELKIIQLDASGDKAQIELLRNGKSVDTGIIDNTPATYVYTRDIGKADDVPLIAISVDSVFSGTETDMLVIKGIFQISEDYKSVKNDDRYGEMEITSTSKDGITMKNDDDITLDEGKIVPLMGNIKFLVADSSTLRFALYEEITEPGTHDVRGTVYDTGNATSSIPTTWTPMNFEGFYYDIDKPLGTEKLEIKEKGTSIGNDKLIYSTTVQSVKFDCSDWGKYNVIGFMAEKYFAGYDEDETDEITDETISLVSDKMLSKVLIDEDDKHTVSTGASLELQEGYELKIIQLDASGDKAQIELLRNGKSVDTGIIDNTPATYVYTRDIGKADDVPLIAISVDSVFSGTETDMLVIKGIFQISEDYKSVEIGDTYGEMEITSTSNTGITMKNDDDIDLDKGGKTMIMGDVGIMTSDGGARYCLFVRRTIGSLPSLAIDVSDPPIVDTEITITITSDGSPVEGAEVKFAGENLGLTDSDGEIRFTSEEAGTFTITARKNNYDPASEEIRILTEDEAEKDPLEIAMLEKVEPGEDVVIKVTSDGDVIEGASVIWDGEDIGETDETGSLTYTTEDAGTYTVTASKAGYLNASEEIKVAFPSAEFELADLTFPAEMSANKKFTITVDVTNTGDADGTYLAELMVDGTAADSTSVDLDAGETTTVEFTHKISKAGTYTIEIGSESGEVAVTKAESNTALVAAALIVLAALGAIGYVLISSAPEGGWTVEKLIEAIKDKFRKGGKGL